MPARRREPAEQARAPRLLVEMHRLRIELGRERDDLLARDQPRSEFGHLAGREIFPMEAGHGNPARCCERRFPRRGVQRGQPAAGAGISGIRPAGRTCRSSQNTAHTKRLATSIDRQGRPVQCPPRRLRGPSSRGAKSPARAPAGQFPFITTNCGIMRGHLRANRDRSSAFRREEDLCSTIATCFSGSASSRRRSSRSSTGWRSAFRCCSGCPAILTGLTLMAVHPLGGIFWILASLVGVVIGVIFARIVAEFVLIMFRINEHLGAIRNRGQM